MSIQQPKSKMFGDVYINQYLANTNTGIGKIALTEEDQHKTIETIIMKNLRTLHSYDVTISEDHAGIYGDYAIKVDGEYAGYTDPNKFFKTDNQPLLKLTPEDLWDLTEYYGKIRIIHEPARVFVIDIPEMKSQIAYFTPMAYLNPTNIPIQKNKADE